jgi:pimeloyl-ACP methyl ester carboxylesterase
MTDRPTPVVLVHGAWHGGWCWDPFMPYLTARGLAPHAPDLPGHGNNPMPMKDITLDSYADCIVDVLDSLDEPAILVGHSLAGATISAAAERRPDKVKYLVYIAAFLLSSDWSLSMAMQNDDESAASPYVQRSDDRLSIIMPEEGLRAATYEGMSEEQIQWCLPRLQPEPIAPIVTPLELTQDNIGRVPRAYVECTKDKAITIGMQRWMQEDLPCDPVLTLDCGHMAPWVEPDRVADFIASLK